METHWYDQINFTKRIQVTNEREALAFIVFLQLHTLFLLMLLNFWLQIDNNLSPRKAPSYYKSGHYLKSNSSHCLFSHSSFNLGRIEESISTYWKWHFPWRGDDGRRGYKGTPHLTILHLFHKRLDQHLDLEALGFNFNLSILFQWPFPFTTKRQCSVWHFCSSKSPCLFDF